MTYDEIAENKRNMSFLMRQMKLEQAKTEKNKQ